MARQSLNLQDNFLNQARRENLRLVIVMLDGSQIECQVKGFDNFTVVVTTDNGTEHLIYKHAISQLVSPKPLVSQRPPFSREGGRPPRGENRGAGRQHERKPQPGPDGASKDAPKATPAGDDEDAKDKPGFNKLDLSGINLEDQ